MCPKSVSESMRTENLLKDRIVGHGDPTAESQIRVASRVVGKLENRIRSFGFIVRGGDFFLAQEQQLDTERSVSNFPFFQYHTQFYFNLL